MARSPFPSGDFGRRVSDPVIGTSIGAPGAGAAFEVAGAAHAFGREVRGMAERAWTREGQTDAAQAIAASAETGIDPRIRQGRGVDDQAYNTVIRADYAAKRQTAYLDAVDQARLAHPDNLGAFTEALTAARGAFAPTGDPQIDADFAQFVTLKNGEAVRAVRQGEEVRRVQTARGAFVNVATTAETVLGQSIASAGFDDEGAALVGASLNQFRDQLARFGPREAFSVGGVEYAADPTRAAAVSSEELAKLFDGTQATARTSWIAAAVDRMPDAAAKQAFAAEVRQRWEAGDLAFAGLGLQDMARLETRLDGAVSSAASAERAAADAAGELAREMIRAGEYGGEVDPEQVRAAAAASGDAGLMAQVEFGLAHGFDVTPAELRRAAEGGLGGGIGGAAFDVIDFIMDDLEGSGFVANDNGRGRAQWGITEKSHPAAWADGRIDRAEAYAIYRREYLEPLGPLSAEMQIVAGAAAVVSGVGKAREFLAKAGGDPERFLQLERDWFRDLARRNPGRYADDLRGWDARQGKVRGALQRHRTAVRSLDGFRSDPIGFAGQKGARVGLPAVAEVDPNALFDGSGWGAGLRAQAAAGREMARQFGVPPRILSDSQEDAIKARLAQDPAASLTLARNLAQQMGEDDARRILGEVGRNPGQVAADLHMASLALDAGVQAFAARAVEGRRLMAEGAPAPKWEASGKSAAPSLDDEIRAAAPAFRTMPDLMGPTLTTARAAAAADQARGQLRDPEHYVQSALGRNPYNGHFYGGAAEVNGAQTLLPTWVRADAMDDVLDWVARSAVAGNWGPVYENGQPMPVSELRRMRLQLQPDGRYRMIHRQTGRNVPDRNGRPFEIDLDTDDRHAALRRAYPDLIRPRR